MDPIYNEERPHQFNGYHGDKGHMSKPKNFSQNAGYNLLEDLKIDRPNQVWQVDITYTRTRKGFANAFIDVYSRYLVGWSLSNTMDSSFCLDALNKSLEQGLPEIINSDQGTQFTSEVWINSFNDHGILVKVGA